MKRFRKLIPVLLLAVFGYCMPVLAKDAKDDAVIQWKANENQKGAGLTLVPTEDMIGNAATTLQITLEIADNSGKLTGADVTFDGTTAGAYRLTDSKYTADTKMLNIFISNQKALFDAAKKSYYIGTVNVNVDAQEYQVSIIPVSVKYVNQSHVTEELKEEDLKGMEVTLLHSSGTNPDKPNPDNPNIPDNPSNPDNPTNPDKPNPDNPDNPDKPNPDKPNNPDNPNSNAVFDKAEDVVDELNNGKHSEIRFNIDKKTGVKEEDQKAVFKALKGKNKAVTFAVEDGGRVMYSFTFRGDQLTNENIVMDFGMKSGVSNKEIEKLMEKDAKYLILDFAHSGALPGPAEVSVYVGDKFADGQKLFLYYYNPDKKAVEPVNKDIVAAGGYASFELIHCSSYVLTTKEVRGAGAFPVPGVPTLPQNNGGDKASQKNGVLTGDTAPLAVLIVVLIAAIGGIAWAIWRKTHK